MDGYRVAEGVDRASLDACRRGVLWEEGLHLAFLERPFTAREEVGAGIAPHPYIGAQEFGGVAPQGFLTSYTVLESPDAETASFEVDVIGGERVASSTRKP